MRSWSKNVTSNILQPCKIHPDYGSTAYSSASPFCLKQLNVIQNQALRIATAAFLTSPTHSPHACTSIFSLQFRRHYFLMKYFTAINLQTNHINVYKIIAENENNHKKPRLIGTIIKQLLSAYNIEMIKLLHTRRKYPFKYVYQKFCSKYKKSGNNPSPAFWK